ncbi:MAG: hypothetical protein LBR38_04220 [Synergistaceae bacterium]|jgi:hypothetical protein|nr:hypothetical protein [Synergistaceae bacterium]
MSFRSISRLLLALAVFAGMAGSAMGAEYGRPGPWQGPGPGRPGLKIFTAGQLLHRLELNEARFISDFSQAGVFVMVGVADSISHTMGNITVRLRGDKPFGFARVVLEVPSSYRSWAYNLDKGDVISGAVYFTNTISMGSPVFRLADTQPEY